MARHINEKSVMSMVDNMDEMDGTEYDPALDPDEENEDEEEGAGNLVEDDEEEAGNEEEGSAEQKEVVEKPAAKSVTTDEDKPDPSTFRKQGANFVDAKNNIVDPQTGQIIAKAGTERRLFEKTQRLNNALDERTQRLQKYESEDKTIDNLRGKIKSHGMSVDEFAEGINMVIAYKSDPVGTAKKVLENVLALGHNVTDILGADAGNAIEMSAVQKMLDDRLKPLLQPLEQKRVISEQEEYAIKQWEKFCDNNPHAEVHEQALDKMLGDNPDLTPQKAYNALREFAFKHQLDFSLPLGPQIAAKSAPNKEPAKQAARTQKSFPNGSSVRQAPMDDGSFNPNDDWATLVKKAMPGLRN